MASLVVSLTNFVIGLIELLIGVRFALKLFGANQGTPFVAWINETTQPLVNPFVGIFPNPVLTGGFILEFSSLVAMVVYAVIGYLLTEFVSTVAYNSRRRVVVD